MFHNLPSSMLDRMRELESIDARDREDGTPPVERLRQIPPETGKFIALLAANAPEGDFLEIGTSAGYSTLWLSLAARLSGRRVVTFEILPEKIRLAQETFRQAGIEGEVELIAGDARDYLPSYTQVAFCFLDAEKNVYLDCYELVVPRLVPGGTLAADNAINHAQALQPFLDQAAADERVDSLVVPIGKGLLVARKV